MCRVGIWVIKSASNAWGKEGSSRGEGSKGEEARRQYVRRRIEVFRITKVQYAWCGLGQGAQVTGGKLFTTVTHSGRKGWW